MLLLKTLVKFPVLFPVCSCFPLTSPLLFLACRVKHLILADPWGFPQKSIDPQKASKIPLWARMIGNLYKNFNPLWPVRFVGPLGKRSVKRERESGLTEKERGKTGREKRRQERVILQPYQGDKT